MRLASSFLLASLACLVLAPARAETADTFKAAYDKAEAANKKAGQLRNQWTTTTDALKSAKKAADSGDFDAATELAKHAEALANASVAQTEREDKMWTESEIR